MTKSSRLEPWVNRAISLSTTTKSKASAGLISLKALDAKAQKKLFLAGGALAICNVALSLFSLYTLISFGLMAAFLAGYAFISIKEIKKEGLIRRLSAKTQKLLLERSLFDLLCDLWYFPRISIFIKALVTPFVFKIDPEDAVNQFQEFSEADRETVLTKGLVNLMPKFIQSALLPAEEAEKPVPMPVVVQEKVKEIVHQVINLEEPSEQNEIIFTKIDTTKVSMKSSTTSSVQNEPVYASTDDDCSVSCNLSQKTKIELLKNHLSPLRQGQHPNEITERVEVVGKMEKTTTVAREKGSSKKKVQLANTWDQLDLYTKTQREKLRKEKLSGPVKEKELKGALLKLQKVSKLLTKDAIMAKFESKKILKIFLISSLALYLQFSLSKRTRVWLQNTLSILLYITGFTLTSGSIALLMVKLKLASSQKNKPKMAIVQELNEKEENDQE